MRAALVLAAGASRRFGRRDKLLAPLGGKPLLLHALEHALAANPRGRVLLVLPSPFGRLARVARRRRDPRVRLVVAREHRAGLGASLAAGLAAARPVERELLIFLGDMPQARSPRGLRLLAGHDAARPVRNGRPGHPLLVRIAAARAARLNCGDLGLAGALDPQRLRLVRAPAANGLDIDTPRALARARRLRRRRD